MNEPLINALNKFSYFLKELNKTGCTCGALPPGEVCAHCLTIGAARHYVKIAKREAKKINV